MSRTRKHFNGSRVRKLKTGVCFLLPMRPETKSARKYIKRIKRKNKKCLRQNKLADFSSHQANILNKRFQY